VPLVTECRRHRVLVPLGKSCPRCTSERNAIPHRAAHRGAEHERIKRAAFARDGHACVYCGSEEDLTVDYVEPLAFGGEMTLENAVTACGPCNSSRGARAGNERR
jgi:5-methylcytosine-specific restriction endonuclease McrA